MKKKLWVWGAAAILVTLLVWRVEWVTEQVYREVGRRKTYPQGSLVTRYPGNGENMRWVEERLWVLPKVGEPKFVPMEQGGNYPSGEYEVINIPAQEQWFFTVGKVAGWEQAPGASDKYLRLNVAGQVRKYRVAMAESQMYGLEQTALGVEEVRGQRQGGLVEVASVESVGRASEVGEAALTTLVRRGDSVIVLPVWAPPELAKKDEYGHYLISWLIVRRVGGKARLLEEMGQVKGEK